MTPQDAAVLPNTAPSVLAKATLEETPQTSLALTFCTTQPSKQLAIGLSYRRGNGKGRGRGRSGRSHPSKRLTRDDDGSDAISGTYMPCCMHQHRLVFNCHLMTARFVMLSLWIFCCCTAAEVSTEKETVTWCLPPSSLPCMPPNPVCMAFPGFPGLIIGATSY